MVQASEKRHWDRFWESSQNLDEVYANDGRIVDFLSPRVDFSGLKVLEVGAGTGRDSDAIAARGAEVWTLDYSEQSLKLMSDTLTQSIHIVCGDALALPVASESFDVVFHQGLLEHFRDPSRLLAENQRILKQGGLLLVDVPQRFHYYTLAKHFLMFLDRWFAGWETEFSVRELEKLVADQGFEIVGMYGHNLYPPIWYRALHKLLLRAGIRIPMNPPGSGFVNGVRRLIPPSVRLSTSMVIGCLGKKR
ncbi:MAG: class I SAM-dependent methyltransferase [Candidatus Krumholzibacteriota bacterium]|nr:class I SAM-dependent methyltransferase [Candidatus Krumholzibacteriota bacterium]